MKTKVSPSLIGAFVLGAIALAAVALVAFGSMDFLHKRERFLVYFDESIQGLTVGSPVKLSGVPVGRVINFHVRYDPATNHSAVAVLCEFDRNIIYNAAGHVIDVTNRREVQSLVAHGLRAQLGVLGLATGLLYIELNFVKNPRLYPPKFASHHPQYVVIPEMPSTISELYANATAVLNKLNEIDYAGLASDMRSLMQEARGRLEGVDFKGLVAQWTATGASVNRLVSSPEILETFRTFDATLTDVRRAVNQLNGQVGRNGADLHETLQQAQAALRRFNDAALTLQRFIAAQQGLGDGAVQAINRISEAADSVRQLADFLQRNPNALIVGRKMTP
ncbi:MAG: MlaD family protein [Opitutaceae bacterium]